VKRVADWQISGGGTFGAFFSHEGFKKLAAVLLTHPQCRVHWPHCGHLLAAA
jgi:hypothetical protein